MTAAAEPVTLSHEAWEEYRTLYRSDPWEFALDVCGFDRLVERFHKPAIYLLTHQVDLLIGVLKSPLRSAVITKLKAALKRRGLDYTNPAHFHRIKKFCRKVQLRIFRKSGKTSCGQAAILWDITVDPHHAWAIVSRDDPSAAEMCYGIVKIIQSAAYRFYFPDRIPEDERTNLGQYAITLAGRTRYVAQPCVSAGGVGSGWVSRHFDRIYCDDLTGLENRSTAKLKIVHEFQANKNGLKMPEWDGAFLDFTAGTRWAKNDDAAVLDADPDCLTLYVMIEARTEPVTFGNMLDAGEPTLPEWFDKEQIADEKAEYLKDPKLGSTALLANLFLTIAGEAAKVFNDAIVDKRKFEWWQDEETGKRYVARLQKGTDKVVRFMPRDLERKAGADPAESLTGDPWAVTCLGRDPGDVHYQLKTVMGRGSAGFLDALLYIDDLYNPDQIGIEAGAMQGWVLVAIEKDSRFAGILHKFVAVPTNLRSKRARAENHVASPLERGVLYLSPDEDNPAPDEMKEWDPDNKKAADACIDSFGIAMVLYRTPAISPREIEAAARADNERYQKSIDKDFGIPIENNFSEDDWQDDLDEGTFDFDDDAVGY